MLGSGWDEIVYLGKSHPMFIFSACYIDVEWNCLVRTIMPMKDAEVLSIIITLPRKGNISNKQITSATY